MSLSDCPIIHKYPLLKRLPAEQRACVAAQIEAGIPLTPEQASQMSIPALAGVLLLPSLGTGRCTPAQLEAAFENREQFCRDLSRLTHQQLSKEQLNATG